MPNLIRIFNKLAISVKKNNTIIYKVFNVVVIQHHFIIPADDLKKYYDKFRSLRSSVYRVWISKHEPSKKELKKQTSRVFEYSPKISILLTASVVNPGYFKELFSSLIRQTYKNWELCIAAFPPDSNTAELIREISIKDNRVKVKFFDSEKTLKALSDEAYSLSKGEYIIFCRINDIIAPHAFYEIIDSLNSNKDINLIYSDEDTISAKGVKRSNPLFKPDFGWDTLRSNNYIGTFIVIRKVFFDKIGGFREGFNEAQDYDLVLRAAEQTSNLYHIPKVLYHKRFDDNKQHTHVQNIDYLISARKALDEHLKRRGLSGDIDFVPAAGVFRIKYHLTSEPLISIIIPNKDNIDILKTCLDSILSKSTYKNYEIIIIENNSTSNQTFSYYNEINGKDNIKVVYYPYKEEFNYSRINNYAAIYSSGEYLLFLNNDIEIITAGWIEEMLSFAQRDDIGATGAKLYYSDDTVQHCGCIIGIGGVAGHIHRFALRKDNGYMNRLIIAQNVSAVTGACLLMKKKLFNDINGFNENLRVAYNDIDLCLKIIDRGLNIVVTPYAELYHYESKTRGYEDTPEKKERQKREGAVFLEQWGDFIKKGDPNYNPNLSLIREDFTLIF